MSRIRIRTNFPLVPYKIIARGLELNINKVFCGLGATDKNGLIILDSERIPFTVQSFKCLVFVDSDWIEIYESESLTDAVIFLKIIHQTFPTVTL